MKNKKESLIFLSSYNTKNCGVSSFTKNLIDSFNELNFKINNFRLNISKHPFLYFLNFPFIFLNVFFLLLNKKYKHSILIEYTPTTSGPLVLLFFLFKLFFKVKFILEIHEITDVYIKSPFYKFFVFFEKILINNSKNIIVHNEIHSKYIYSKYGVKDKTFVIPIRMVKNVTVNPENKKRKDFLILGQVRPSKNYEIVIKSYEKYRKLNPKSEHKLIIAGSSADKKYYKKIKGIIESSLVSSSIEMTGYLQEKEMISLLKKSYLMILLYSKVTQSGPFSMAIAYNMPCIVSNLDYFKDFINLYKVGIVSEINEKSLTKCLSVLSENMKIYNYFKNETKRASKYYSWSSIFEKYLKALF